MINLDPAALRRAVDTALAEDLGPSGDRTTKATIDPGMLGTAHIVARDTLVVAGLPVAAEVFRTLDRQLAFTARVNEGIRVEAPERLATVTGRAAAILGGERTALNFLMRMCGIATTAAAAVAEVAGTGATILDTRKTAPGLRLLDKYAVAVGGATNHRLGLHDAVMIKDTHLAAGAGIAASVKRALAAGNEARRVTVEVETIDELQQAIEAGAGRALLDNMDLRTMRRAVELAGGRIVLEASGGLRPGGLRAVAETGVDCLSLGWLTHSAPAADVALEMEAPR